MSCMAEIRLGAVGERDAVLCFKAIGMQVIPTTTAEETTRALFSLTQQGVRVIFITEHAAMQAAEALDRYKGDPQVAIIPIPGSTGAQGYAMGRVKANVEKAIGADILFHNNHSQKEG